MSHSADDKDALLCKVCEKGFRTISGLRAHLIDHDLNPSMVEDGLERAI